MINIVKIATGLKLTGSKISLLILLTVISFTSYADERFCGYVKRNDRGEISRSSTIVRNFKKEYPCPETGLSTGACKGWSVDHVIPLACGGCDSQINLQWLKNSIKSCSGTECKDRWERTIYCNKPLN